ncbi:flagellar basal body L-ring protein FlgH [Helicobacter sp. 11S02629-2]|uniref:flagellar basal body L-ring protein FlgH n=1 Tax=Helicobacter sp. 11S02629-2 TaxID=1476195 RepID=UPI000BA74E01|nr:flagellar basal body L-ring protein FlgH [Helicobacter sp. 11S02629-2]PAF43652.1 flagellar basal body L-ring protein [Helicobacter sp. 11S02629-2]
MKKVLLMLVALAALVRLLAYEPEINLNPPRYVEEMPDKDFVPEISKPGSLFGQGDRPLFADRRAMKPDDLITVLVNETSSSKFDTSKKYNGASGGNITPPQLVYNGTDAQQRANTQYLNDQNNYTLNKANNTSNFTGGGSTSNSGNLSLTVTARILKVMQNGNYFIYGKKEMLVDGEKQIFQISGVIRPYDIARQNTIDSKYISDSKISFVTVGKASDTTKMKPTEDAVESAWPY